MKIKVIIIQGYNTPYRNELFNTISDFEDVDLTLLYISKKGEDRKWREDLLPRFKEVPVRCKVSQTNYVKTHTRLNYIDFLIAVQNKLKIKYCL
ncbi:hypothetical protein D1BOALGB6SA_2385 [Olavius sp. associated proteobacterium Delta 1]|nr:hypothetical protein D1BOALGB6SA_2385 [Olavius sp. associated proteobacterium Delta 1]